MTTAEFMLCEIIKCGQHDIESCFGKMDDDILSEAIKTCKDELGTLDAGAIWEIAIDNAIYVAFGSDINIDDFERYFNYLDTSVTFTGNPEEIENFEEKAEEFYNLTGEELTHD